ncbi:MAG: UrcA family protein [Steroidobacteraceae bacterium]|nr:UrcA family protein [Steroidobacteraceae bacterium]
MPSHRTFVATVVVATAGLVASVASATGRPAAAAASVEVSRVVVSYGDLNLDSERGVQQLQRRLVGAAREVCGRPEPRDLRLAARARECADAAIARAVAEVGNARLARLNAGRSKSLRG